LGLGGWVYDPLLVRILRPARLLAAALLVGGVTAGCAEGETTQVDGSAAATVNGVEIPSEVLVDTTIGANDLDPNADSLATSDTTGILDRLISLELAQQQLDDLGVEVTQDDRDAALPAIYDSMGQDPTTGATDRQAGQQAFEASPEGFQEALVDLQVLPAKLADHLPEGSGDPQRCATYVQVDPATGDQAAQTARANDIVDGINSGDDVQEYITAETADPSQPAGGQLPCATEATLQQQVQQGALPAEIADPIFDTEIGGAFGPVVLDQGVFVVVVETEGLGPDTALQFIDQVSLDADVWVDPRYGEWVYFDETGNVTEDRDKAVRGGVAPPEGPEPPPAGTDTTTLAPGQAPVVPVSEP
jgi:hypothetical protein